MFCSTNQVGPINSALALLVGVRNHYDVFVGLTMGWGVRRTAELVKFRWKKAKSRRDHAEAKNTQTGDKSYQSTDYRDMVLNIIGGAN